VVGVHPDGPGLPGRRDPLADTPVLDPARTVTTDVNRVLWAQEIPETVHVATGLVTTIVDARSKK
jgi:hypothetical protein